MRVFLQTAVLALAIAQGANAFRTSLRGEKMTVGKFRRELEAQQSSLEKRDDALPFPEHNMTTPVDHFHNETKYAPHSDGTFDLRYWFDATYYEPGGPVFVLQAGEASGTTRVPILVNGILHQLAKATHGIGVVMEHRYYGTSFPVPDLSTENMRFLSTQQAMADIAYFAQNIQFPGLEKFGDITSKTTPYIGYGGSYAGALNAFLRVQYPEVFWGTISSSGVTMAIYDYWEYYAAIAQFGPSACVEAQQTLIHIGDNILIGKNESELTAQFKEALGMPNVTFTNDFANQLSAGISGWQSLNWDPAVSSPGFYQYCANITSDEVLYPDTESLRSTASHLITEGGYSASTARVNQMLNYIGYINLTAVAPCTESGSTQDECFSTHNATFYTQDSLEDYGIRSWPYQYCTEWGFLQTGSGVPADQLPLISRVLDVPYEMIICNDGFNITSPADTELANKYGGYNISYPRLAILDGLWDPWRPATPHAFEYGAKERVSTASEPFILISDAIHHWDENGVFPNETTATFPPLPVADAQKNELMFVQEWLEEWELHCLVNGGCAGQAAPEL